MWLVSDKPITVRTASGEVKLAPGVPHEVPEAIGQRVLERAGDNVRIYLPASDTIIDPASPTARPIYWEGGDGQLYGPATPEFLAKTGAGKGERFWVVASFEGTSRWIRSDRLRAKPRAAKPVGT